MVVVVSNRNINVGATDHTLFGDDPNAKGLDEIRVATAEYTSANQWQVNLFPESDNLDPNNRPSRSLFKQILAEIQTGKRGCHWLFFIHGFNQSFLGNLETCRHLEQTYNVEVMTFSWPSNPGGFVTNEYQKARQAARASSNALDRTLEMLGKYLSDRPLEEIAACSISLNLFAHSLGNYLFENFVRDPIFSEETRIFDNFIVHQADVDNLNHVEWFDRLKSSKRIYVTINESDSALKVSDTINPARLGNTLQGLHSERAIYVDFTGAKNVGSSHGLFRGIEGNEALNEFFRQVFTGGHGERVKGFQYDPRTNTFRIEEEA